MEPEAPAKARSGDSKGNLFLFASAGIGIYVLLRTLDPVIAFPLRMVSTALATVFLNAISIPATREGTAISTLEFSFDVNPDCSGSTSLRVMLTLGALWFGMYPNLSLGRRIFCLVLAAPIAVLCNAIRVMTLVALGDKIGRPVEGLPHELIGVLAFALAMAMVYGMTLLMAREPEVRQHGAPRAHLAVLVAALAVCYAPVLTGPFFLNLGSVPILSASLWTLFVLAGFGLLVLSLWSLPNRNPVSSWVSCVLFTFALVLLVAGTMGDVISMSSLSFLVLLFTLVLHFRGWVAALFTMPLLGVVSLGLPSMLIVKLHGFARALADGTAGRFQLALLVESLLACALIVFFVVFCLRRLRGENHGKVEQDPTAVGGHSVLTSPTVKFFILLAFVGILFQTFFNSQAAAFDDLNRLDVASRVGEWEGIDLEPTAGEVEVFGRDRILSRRYVRERFDPVHLLVSATGADRDRTHKPEICMTGSGWKVQKREIVDLERAERPFAMTKLLLERDTQLLEMRYWFDDGEGMRFGRFERFLPVDTARRLAGKRTDWHVYRVFAPPGSPAMEDFIGELTR